MTEVVLVIAPFPEDLLPLSVKSLSLPLDLAYIAALLKEHDLEVKIIDSIAHKMGSQEVIDAILRESPSFVIFSSMISGMPKIVTIPNTIRIVSEIKKNNRELSTVLIGEYVGLDAYNFLEKFREIDAIAIADPEYPILNYILWKKGEIPHNALRGVALIKNGKIKMINDEELPDNLDVLPIPAYEELDVRKYLQSNGSVALITSRGCPYDCIYCAHSAFWGKRVREHSNEYVLRMMSRLEKKFGARRFGFIDEVFTLKKHKVKRLCTNLSLAFSDISWTCFSRIDTVDKELLQSMYDAGCSRIYYGVETGSQRILDETRKGFKISEVAKVTDLTKDIGIEVGLFMMLGLPYESKKTVEKSINLIKRVKPDKLDVSFLIPYPRTVLFKRFEKYNMCSITDNLERYSKQEPVVETRKFSKEYAIYSKMAILTEAYLAKQGGVA